jgi:hypothetical protein
MDASCTTPRIGRLCGMALGLLCAASAASAQGKTDNALMMRYGGVLAPDCSNYMLPQLKYLGDSLVVQEGGKAVLTGRNIKAVPGYFGSTPPPEFENALASEVAPGQGMVFVFYRNASGLFATVEGAPQVVARLPAAFKGKRARHCDPNRNAVPGKPATAPAMPTDLLKDASFKRAYTQALGPLGREPWLARLDGPGQPVTQVQVAGKSYRMVSVCKTHDCYENSMLFLYAPGAVYGTVYQSGRSTLVGSPPPAVAAELQRLWKLTYRGNR